MSDLLIQNCTVLQVARDFPEIGLLPNHDVLIRGNRIEAVQPTGKVNASRFRQTIAGNGLLAMPGLINTHSHVPMVILRGLAEDVTIERWFNDFMWPLESNLQADDVYWGMQLGLAEMIEAGVTSVADHYFFMDEAAKAVEQAGTRALLGWAVFGSNGLDALAHSADFVVRWQGAADGRIRTWMAPHAPYTCDDDFLRATVAHAEQLGVGIHIHAAETVQQTEASVEKRGITPIEVLRQTGVLDVPTIIAHGCGLTPDDIDLLSNYLTGVASAPKTYLKLAMQTTPVLALNEAGVPVGLATDGAVSNNTLDIWESMRLTALMQKDRATTPEVLTIPEALYIATRGSARVFGMPDTLGSVEAGYLADVILVDLNGTHHQPLHSVSASLVYNARASDVRTVIADGQVVMRDRQHLTLDVNDIAAHVRENMGRLAERHPAKRIQVYNP